MSVAIRSNWIKKKEKKDTRKDFFSFSDNAHTAMDVSLVRVMRLLPTLVVDNASQKILVQDLRGIFVHSVEQFLACTNIGYGVQCKRHGRFQWQFLGNCGSIRHMFQTDHYTYTPWEHSTFVQHPKAGATFADKHGRIWNFLEIRKAHRVSWSSLFNSLYNLYLY